MSAVGRRVRLRVRRLALDRQQGDVAALAALYDRVGARAYAVALALTREEEAAGEAVVRGFLGFWRDAGDAKAQSDGHVVVAVAHEALGLRRAA